MKEAQKLLGALTVSGEGGGAQAGDDGGGS